MLKHFSVKADPMADAESLPEKKNTPEAGQDLSPEETQVFQLLSRKRDVAPIAYMPRAFAANPKSRTLRRILTREQGHALEMIGHAVEYLNDCYIYEGDDNELMIIGGSCSEAIQILVSARSQVLYSAPVRKPRVTRLWNALFHHDTQVRQGVAFHRANENATQSKPVSVLPLSSSR